MERSAYRRTTARRQYARRANEKRRGVSPLLTCLGLLLFAVAIHYVFPHFSKAVGDKVNAIVDYRAAFAVIGEGLSGERKLSEALGDAWTLAFHGGGGDAQEAGAPETSDAAGAQAFANGAADAGETAAEGEISKTEEIADDGGVEPKGDGDSIGEAVIAAFVEAQRDYPEYMLPAGADYGVH